MKNPIHRSLFLVLFIILYAISLSSCLYQEDILPTVVPSFHSMAATPENPKKPVNSYTTREQFSARATATEAAFARDHVTGSIEINGQNQGTIGALAMSTIDIVISFKATSPFAEITEMRLSDDGYGPIPSTDANGITTCGTNELESQWQPFIPSKLYPFDVPENWSAFSIAVQYKDSLGNISPVYCDTLQIEGGPPVTP